MQVPSNVSNSNPQTARNLLQAGDLRATDATQARDKLNSAVRAQQPSEVEQAFQDFVGQTFFAEMIKAFRSTQQPSAYFHGGRAEEIFQGQFDQTMAEELSDSSAQQISEPMFELFMLGRQR